MIGKPAAKKAPATLMISVSGFKLRKAIILRWSAATSSSTFTSSRVIRLCPDIVYAGGTVPWPADRRRCGPVRPTLAVMLPRRPGQGAAWLAAAG